VTAVRTTFLTWRAAARHMIRQGSGVILAFGGSGPPPRDYYIGGTQVAFEAIESLRRQIPSELGSHGIRVVTLRTGGGVPESISEGVNGREAIVEGIEKEAIPHPPTQVFVLTHEAPHAVPEGSVYTFVTDGIESALEQAKAAAGDKNVAVMGGPYMGRQFIEAGLVDEIGFHLVPVLFGGGIRMFEHLGGEHIQLETTSVIEIPSAIHIRFRVVE
jgi:dihydrofolate reductase